MPDHERGCAERSLHGHLPQRPREYQILAALFKVKTGARISDAIVSLELSRPGSFRSKQGLEPIQIEGAATYGGLFELPVLRLKSFSSAKANRRCELRMAAEVDPNQPVPFEGRY
jgi:hypothetical protein